MLCIFSVSTLELPFLFVSGNSSMHRCRNLKTCQGVICDKITKYAIYKRISTICKNIHCCPRELKSLILSSSLRETCNDRVNRGIPQPPKIDFKIDRKSTVIRYKDFLKVHQFCASRRFAHWNGWFGSLTKDNFKLVRLYCSITIYDLCLRFCAG